MIIKKKRKKKRKEKKERQVTQEKKKKSAKKSNVGEGATVHGHFHPKMTLNFSLQFSLQFGGGEKEISEPGEKTPGPHYLSSFLLT